MAACSLQVQIDSDPIRLVRDQKDIFLTVPFTMRFPVQDLVDALISFKRHDEADKKVKVDARASQPATAAMTAGQSLPTTVGPSATQQASPDVAAGQNLQASSVTCPSAERSVDPSLTVSVAATPITWDTELSELHQNHKEYVTRTKWRDNGDCSILKDRTNLQNFVPASVEAPRPVRKRPGQYGNPPTIQLPAKAPPSHLIPGSQANAGTSPVPEAPPPGTQTHSSGGDISKALAPLASRATDPSTETSVSMAVPKPKVGVQAPKSANLSTDAAGKAAGVAENHSLGSPAANQVSTSWGPGSSGADDDQQGDVSGTGRHPRPPAVPPPPLIAGAIPAAPPPPPPPAARGQGGHSEANRECQSQ